VIDCVSRRLFEEMQKAVALPLEWGQGDALLPRRSRAEIARVLFRSSPQLAAVLKKPIPTIDDLPVVRDVLSSALTRKNAREERDLIIMGVHDWLSELSSAPGLPSDAAQRLQRDLGALGVQVGVGPGAEGLGYCGSLLDKLVDRAGENPWTDDAFLSYLELGGDTKCSCDGDQSLRVIERGESYLQGHPRSPIRSAVQLALARAHETAWALSKPSYDEEGMVDPAPYVLGGPEHREEAMRLYRSVIARAPAGVDISKLNQLLRRIEVDVDTGRLVYFCYWD
jgi:hypothetical protein